MTASAPLAAVITLAWLLGAPVEHPPEPWVPGVRTEWTIGVGETRRHVVTLQPGEFVRVTIMESDIDLSVRVHGPDGLPGPVEDFSARGWELSSILASSAGEYALEVKASPDALAAGVYVLDSDAVRVAGPADHRRLIAEAARARSGPGLGRLTPHLTTVYPSAEAAKESASQLPIAAEIFHELGETCLEAESLTSLALLAGWGNRPSEVLDLHPRAVALWERCDDVYKRAQALGHAAEGYQRLAQYARAALTYERGLALAREIGAHDLELILLTNVSGIYNALGDTEGAIRSVEAVLPLLRASNIKQGEAVALRILALAHVRRGDYQQAADRARESLALRREIGDSPGEVMTLITLGQVYLSLGEPATARQYLDEALARAYPRPMDNRSWPHLLIALASVYEEMGDRARALATLEESLENHQRLDMRANEPFSLLALGRFYAREGDFEPALEAGREADRLLRAAGESHALAGALELQGEAALGLREAARAQGPLEESLGLRRLVGDGPGEARALHLLARVDLARGDAQGAGSRLEQALRLVESTRAGIVSPELRSTWLAGVRGIHETYVEALMELHRRDPRAGWSQRAFEASESARARSLLDLLAESRAQIRQGIDADLLARERSLRERLGASLERQLRAATKEGASESADLAAEIQSLSTEYEELRGRIRITSPRYAALTQPDPLSLERVRSDVLDAETILLEYGLGSARSYLWVIGRDLFGVHELPGQKAIEEALGRARPAFGRRPKASDSGALAALSLMLLGPAREHLAGRRLAFVPDGPLHHVPFAALPDANGRPLVESHEIVASPSASALAGLRRTAGERPSPKRTLAVLADPVFDRNDERVRSRAAAPGSRDLVLERAMRSFDFAGGALPRLQFTRREARSIAALVPASSLRMELDFAASRGTVNDRGLEDYRIVHFATHGLLNDVRPELSGLVLSLVDRDGRDMPGLLTAPDVFNLKLSAELVVLSGCRTSLGKEVRGEGMVGLTRAFMYAGVPRVVASLWPVDDLATAELMKRFYEGMLGPLKLRPAAALRRAQAQMAGDPRWKAPYYWAGFQLQGDWR